MIDAAFMILFGLGDLLLLLVLAGFFLVAWNIARRDGYKP